MPRASSRDSVEYRPGTANVYRSNDNFVPADHKRKSSRNTPRRGEEEKTEENYKLRRLGTQ